MIHRIFPSKSILLQLLSVLFINNLVFSQTDKFANADSPDYKITSSNESYIELEFFPNYNKNDFDFSNALSNTDKYGLPDVKFRAFPIYLPADAGNRIEILDAKYTDISNVEIKPVPTFKYSKDKEGIVPEFNKNEKVYSENKFFPSEIAYVNQPGIVRNKYFGYVNIYPLLYNPVTNSVRKHDYIKVRVTFGGSPVYSNKTLSKEERIFLSGVTINSDLAANWSTKEFNNIQDLPVLNSALAYGDFYKIEVKETGMYKIDKNFLQGAGINVSGIDPRTIRIYGNNGSELPYDNSKPVSFDLVENKIFVFGEDDGQFDDNDYVIFYGKNPNDWIYDPLNKTYLHTINHFSKSNYYWFTFGNGSGERMQAINSPNVPGIIPLTSFRDRFFEEPEVNNPGSTGYLWISQRIGTNEAFTFNKELKGYINESNVNVRFKFGNGSAFSENWRIEDLNSGFFINVYVPPISNGFSHINLVDLGDNRYGVYYPLSPGRTGINFKASLPSSLGNSANVSGYYDYFEVLYDRIFSADNNSLRFNSPDTTATIEYQVSNFNTSEVRIFDVTTHSNANMINPISYSNGIVRFQSNQSKGSANEYYAIGGNNYKTPSSISSKVANQNLKGELSSGASFVIISPKEFLSSATRLKVQREAPGQNYIKTFVVDIEKIFNEFSSGLPDPVAMRNFLKYATNNWDERPVYVMFLGDGSYDYKNIYNLYNNGIKNWIPPIEKDSEFGNDIDSYCSDDYIVELNENHIQPEGTNIPDLAHGRLCINSLEEANAVLDKILSYENPAYFDKWKNVNMYVGDDGWSTEQTGGQEGSLHTDQCEDIAQNHTPRHFKKDKIYIVSYPSEYTPQGRRKPGVNADIIKGWNEGRLVINYTGHGSTDLWAHEHIFERQVSIPLLNNKNKYPFITIASCDLARWDDPFLLSAGEQLVNLKDKGAIGVSAAVRPVYSIPNAIFNSRFYDNFLMKKDTFNLPLRSGKAMFNVKQELYFDNDLKFALLCDPSLRVGVPQYFTKVDSINNTSGDSLFTMKALQKIKLSGKVLRIDSTFWSDYNGNIDICVLDVDKNINLLDFGYTFNYKLDGGTIYTGRTNIVNGRWTVDFIVPRDISYNPGAGKIITYFKNNSSDGVGFYNRFIMNGLDSTAQLDSIGPVISLFMDNRNFRTGDMVNQNPKLIADFFDESGMNLTGTIGHKIEGIINDDENNKIDLTSLYNSTSNFQNGSVEYGLKDLADGKYTLTVKAWDTYNNFSTGVTDFIVRSSNELELTNIYNYPNPMQDFTSFVFQHNFDNPLMAEIKIYTVSGRLIKELNKTNISEKFANINWDGKDSDGDDIANGTYVFKIIIKSEDGNFSKSSTGKLAKLK